jgi:hypothetical protein
MKMGKIYKLTKLIAFVAAGIAILILNKNIMTNDGAILNGLVGSIIAIYGLEGIILPIATKKIKAERIEMLNGGVNLLIAIIMIFLLEGHPYELRIVCVLWSLWSIMREGVEIFDKGFVGIRNHPITSAVNFAESIVVIVFSIELIIAKDAHELEHHAHAHVILLGIELIIEVIWVYVGEFEARILRRLRRRRTIEEKEQLQQEAEQKEEQKQGE